MTGAIVGVAIPLVLFRLLAPERSFPVSYRRGKSAHLPVDGPRGQAIRRALADQLGIGVAGVEPFGTAGSGGSTPLRIQVAGEPQSAVFGKLYALTHLRSDRWYKLGRMMLYGALEDEKPFNSVRRLVEYEDYMLRLMADVGVPSAAPYGFVELTPEREYLLVAEFLAGGKRSWTRRSAGPRSATPWPSSAGCGTPASPTATSSPPTCWPATGRSS